jgi:two-component system response regulator PilR (NtrC family)
MSKKIESISPEAMRRLESYDWPGNVRELENTIERAVALESGPDISLAVLPDRVAGSASALGPAMGEQEGVQIPVEGIDFERVIAGTEKRYLRAALEKAGGVRTQAAELLKISYRSFRHYAKKHEL